jgi:alpha-galactosidase
MVTEEKTIIMEKQGLCFSCEDAVISFAEQKEAMDIEFQAGNSEVRFLVLRWNGSWERKYQYMGDALERSYGNLEWMGLDAQRIMPWYFLASDGEANIGFGVKVRPNALCFWMCDAEGVTLWLDMRSGAMGVILSGRQMKLATIVQKESREGASAFRFAKDFCKSLCENPLLPKVPIYGSNNWYYAYGNSSHKDIMADTALLAELTEGIANRPYMVIDDCWQELALVKGAAGRPFYRGNERFPDMIGLAQEMKDTNVKPGIWVRLLESSEKFLPDSYRSLRTREALDPSAAGVLDLVAEDMERVTGWGYELVKHDFSTYDFFGEFYSGPLSFLKQKGWSLQDRSRTSAECLIEFYKTIYQHSNGAIIIGCNVIGHLAAGYMHLHRSGDDTSGNCFDRSVMMGVNTLAYRLPQHKAFFDIDADCVGITENIPWEENKRFLDLLANSGTPLFISADPKAVTEEMKKDLRIAFQKAAQQKDELLPMDWMTTTIPEEYLINGERKGYQWVSKLGLTSFSSL